MLVGSKTSGGSPMLSSVAAVVGADERHRSLLNVQLPARSGVLRHNDTRSNEGEACLARFLVSVPVPEKLALRPVKATVTYGLATVDGPAAPPMVRPRLALNRCGDREFPVPDPMMPPPAIAPADPPRSAASRCPACRHRPRSSGLDVAANGQCARRVPKSRDAGNDNRTAVGDPQLVVVVEAFRKCGVQCSPAIPSFSVPEPAIQTVELVPADVALLFDAVEAISPSKLLFPRR